jgi:hypothetical protein
VEYILSQHNLQTNESDPLDDPELIMDVMEARETLEQASSRDQVDAVQTENQGPFRSKLSFALFTLPKRKSMNSYRK